MYRISNCALAISLFTAALVGCTPQIAPDDGDMNSNDDSIEFTEVEPMIGDAKSINGSSKLPAGSGLDASTLRVDTHAGEVPVGSDGSFDAETFSNVPTLSMLVDANDTAVLMGFIGGDDGPSDIDAKSTATALLYFAIGGWTLPANRLPELLHEISTSDACADLTDVIETAIASNPTALKDGDANIDAALEIAAAELLSPDPDASDTAKAIQRLARTQGVASSFLTIDPDEGRHQSGARILTAGDTSVNVLNSAARRACLYVFQSAVEDDEGVRTEISPVEQIGVALDVPAAKRIQPGVKMKDVLEGTSFDEVIEGNSAPFWTPGQAGPAMLAPREGATKTELTLVLIGPSLDESSTPAILSDPDHVLLFDEWQTKLDDLQAETFAMEFMIPLAESMSFGTNLALFQDTPTATFSLTQLILPVVEGAGISLDTTAGYTEAVNVVITRALNNLAFRENLIDAIVEAYSEDTGSRFSRNRLNAHFTRLAEMGSVQSAINLGMAGDAGRMLEDLRGARSASTWIAEFSNVRLTPDNATITRDNRSAIFTANLATDAGGSITYEWSRTGATGELLGFNLDGSSVSGNSITSNENSIEYFVADHASIFDGKLATVSVDVFDGDTFIGSASATVSGKNEEEDEDEPFPCETVGFSDKPSTQFVSLDVPSTVTAGDVLTFSITLNRAGIEAFSKKPVSVSASRLTVSASSGGHRNNQGQVLLNGSPMVDGTSGNFSTGSIGHLSTTDPVVEASTGLVISSASPWVRFPADGPSTLTISVPIPEQSQTRCASSGLIDVVSISLSSFPNQTDDPIPYADLFAFAQFVILPQEN
ncbi:MAG: hypothetical protein DHS20C16_30240 [Phycisphaerae bacterium]|nr:MAG: hypothetical protein DHS20C16_30240 [Phycisphaerae bacterium]